MTTLRDISLVFRRLVDLYNDESTTDEERLELEEQIIEVDLSTEEKASNYAELIDWYETQTEIWKREKQRIERVQKRHERTAEWLRRNLGTCLQIAGKTSKFTHNFRTFRFQKSTAVEITDITKIPEEYLRHKDPEPKKDEIKRALKDGKVIEGAHLEPKMNLIIS